MIPLLSAAEARAFDARAVAAGIGSIQLMENAGAGAARVLLNHFPEARRGVVVLGGPGQNGGDAWVVARHLLGEGIVPRVFLIGNSDRLSGDSRTNFDALRGLGVDIEDPGTDLGTLREALQGTGAVVDGLFGTGLDRDVTGPAALALSLIHESGRRVLSLDLPSGVDANTGALRGVAVRAAVTCTFGTHKRGLHQLPGAELAGHIVPIPLGVPPAPLGSVGRVEASDIPTWLGRRAAGAHKGTNGHILVVGGSPGTAGAAVLAGLGALRAGAGKVSLWTRAPGLAAPPELMVHHLDDSGNDGERILVAAEGAAAVVVGPGLGIDGPGRTLSKLLVEKLPAPAVIDADALSALADDPGPAQRAVTPRVWTPHPGEAARLLRTTAAEVEANRYQGARELVDRYGHVAVLKGAFTIVADATRQWVSGGAAPALAVGGAGDVLAGVIGAQLAFLSPMEASAAGAFVHWKAGTDMAFDRGNLAREIADAIGSVLMDAAAP